jgi:hypothetical protein
MFSGKFLAVLLLSVPLWAQISEDEQLLLLKKHRAGAAVSNNGTFPAYRMSTGSATSGLNTTGAKLMIQCNSISAACHTTTFSDSASNTYTAGALHTSGSYNITWYWAINPSTSSSQTWTSASTDSIFISVYGASSGATHSWAADSTATGYDTSAGAGSSLATLTLTPSVTGDIIVTGQSDDNIYAALTCTLTTPGGTNAAPA